MSKKVNLSTVNADFIESLSNYNVALSAIKDAMEVKNKAIEKADEEENKVKENRKKAMEEGKSADEAAAMYSMEPIITARNKAEEDYKKAVAPHKKAQREAYTSVADSVYYAYLLTIDKMSMDAKGQLEIKKGKKTEIHKVERNFKGEVRAFLESINVSGIDNDTALNKAADALRTLTAGGVKSNKPGEFLKAKGMSTFKDLFLRAFMHYGVKRNVFVINDDNTVEMRKFDEATA